MFQKVQSGWNDTWSTAMMYVNNLPMAQLSQTLYPV